jgi:uncharacterized membrane protein YhaH (DUF805 family)
MKVLKDFTLFTGRSRRKEYWMFVLINTCIGFALGFLLGITKISAFGILANVYQLVVFLPAIAVSIRRMHDTNHVGWWILCPLYNLYLLCIDGDPGVNRFGPNPKSA